MGASPSRIDNDHGTLLTPPNPGYTGPFSMRRDLVNGIRGRAVSQRAFISIMHHTARIYTWIILFQLWSKTDNPATQNKWPSQRGGFILLVRRLSLQFGQQSSRDPAFEQATDMLHLQVPFKNYVETYLDTAYEPQLPTHCAREAYCTAWLVLSITRTSMSAKYGFISATTPVIIVYPPRHMCP